MTTQTSILIAQSTLNVYQLRSVLKQIRDGKLRASIWDLMLAYYMADKHLKRLTAPESEDEFFCGVHGDIKADMAELHQYFAKQLVSGLSDVCMFFDNLNKEVVELGKSNKDYVIPEAKRFYAVLKCVADFFEQEKHESMLNQKLA